jgi:hypothetical protein
MAEAGEDSAAGTGEHHRGRYQGGSTGGYGLRQIAKTWERRSRGRCFQMFGAEATNYAKKSLESGSVFIEKLRSAKSFESAIQIQSDYAKSAFTEFMAYLVKMSDLYCILFKRGSTHIEKADRGRQDIGFKCADPGAMEAPRTLARI